MGATESVSRSHRWRKAGVAFTALFVLFNVLAYRHAGSFFFYTQGGARTASPEALSRWGKLGILLTGIRVPKPEAHATPLDLGMRYEAFRVPGREGLELGAWRIAASDETSDATTTVVLFHGYSSEKSGLLPEASLYHAMGFEVILVDFPGSGESPGYVTSLGIREAEDVASVASWFRQMYPERRLVLHGHSMGGAAIMRAMAKLGVRPDAAVVESVFDSLSGAIRQRFRLLDAPSFPAADVLLFWGSVRLGVNGYAHDVVAYASEVDVPVLVVHGREDNRAPWEMAVRVQQSLAGPSTFVLMEQAGHVNPCLSDPARWSGAASEFLAGQVSDK